MLNLICRYFFWFMLYSIAGWIMETLLYLIRDKKAVKRGFLFGPVCPIYGTGAVICTAILYGRVNNIFLIFIFGLLICGALEYITHFLMEKLFNAMWWDYSDRRFNIKGRVYLKGLLIFGAGAVIIVKLLQPLAEKLTDLIPQNILYIICFVLYSFLLVDVTTTIADLKGMVKMLKKIQNSVICETQKGVDLTEKQIETLVSHIKESELLQKIISSMQSDNSILSKIKNRYPDFTLKKYKHILDIVMDKPHEDKGRKDIKLYGIADSIPTADDSREHKANKGSQADIR
ncbi:MAG: putative ABC transporter permease [Eubacterium sp.]